MDEQRTDLAEGLKEAIEKAFEKATESMLRFFDEFSWEHQTTTTKKWDAEVEARKVRNNCARNSKIDKEEMIDVKLCVDWGMQGRCLMKVLREFWRKVVLILTKVWILGRGIC